VKIICMALLFALIALSAQAGEDRSTSSVRWHDGVGEVIMRGQGTATLNQDKVERIGDTIYVNGQTFGTVPKRCEIRYIVSASGSALYVDGKLRHPVNKK